MNLVASRAEAHEDPRQHPTLLPSLTTVYISYIENKRALTAKASEELLGVSAQAVREVDLWTKEQRYDLRVFAFSYEVTENMERLPLVNGEPIHSGIYYKRLTDYLNSVRDRFRLTALFRAQSGIRTSAIDQADDGTIELFGNLHRTQGLAVTLGIG